MSNSSSTKLNEYVLREKELLSKVCKANKASSLFEKKKLFELSNSMDYLAFNIDYYFIRSIISKQSKQKIENEMNKNS